MRHSSRRYLTFAIFAIALGAVSIWVWAAVETRHQRFFLETFEDSVHAWRSEGSMALVTDTMAAADLCETKEAKRIMEERCVDAFRNRDRYAQLVAAHVIYSRDSLSVETLRELSKLSIAFPEGSVRKDELKDLIRLFDERGFYIGPP